VFQRIPVAYDGSDRTNRHHRGIDLIEAVGADLDCPAVAVRRPHHGAPLSELKAGKEAIDEYSRALAMRRAASRG